MNDESESVISIRGLVNRFGSDVVHDGLDLDVLNDRYGVSLRDRRAATLNRLAADGLIHDDPDRVRLTPRGRLLADAVTRRLMRDS